MGIPLPPSYPTPSLKFKIFIYYLISMKFWMKHIYTDFILDKIDFFLQM